MLWVSRPVPPSQQVHTLQDLRDMNLPERAVLLTEAAGLSGAQANDVESVLEMMPMLTVELTCETEGEQEIQEGDLVTLCAWVTLRRRNGLMVALPHAPNYPFPKEESFWLLLADAASKEVWVSQKLNFSGEAAAAAAASSAVRQVKEAAGASAKEASAAAKEAAGKVKAGSRLVMGKFLAPSEGTYELCCFCLCDTWIGCDWKSSLTLNVQKRRLPAEEAVEEEEEPEEEDEDCESEYSDDDNEQVQSKKKNSGAAQGKKSSGADWASPFHHTPSLDHSSDSPLERGAELSDTRSHWTQDNVVSWWLMLVVWIRVQWWNQNPLNWGFIEDQRYQSSPWESHKVFRSQCELPSSGKSTKSLALLPLSEPGRGGLLFFI